MLLEPAAAHRPRDLLLGRLLRRHAVFQSFCDVERVRRRPKLDREARRSSQATWACTLLPVPSRRSDRGAVWRAPAQLRRSMPRSGRPFPPSTPHASSEARSEPRVRRSGNAARSKPRAEKYGSDGFNYPRLAEELFGGFFSARRLLRCRTTRPLASIASRKWRRARSQHVAFPAAIFPIAIVLDAARRRLVVVRRTLEVVPTGRGEQRRIRQRQGRSLSRSRSGCCRERGWHHAPPMGIGRSARRFGPAPIRRSSFVVWRSRWCGK